MHWIPLVQFAAKRGVSLSTLRRYIKQNKIEYRLENGRYLLRDDEVSESPPQKVGDPEMQKELGQKIRKLEKDLRFAQNEIAELKTLIALYEEKFPNKYSS